MKIKDLRYNYHITVSAHFIIEKDNKVLIAKRPKTWEWAPGRWSTIGGKVYQDETIMDCVKRKTNQELGYAIEPKGLYEIKQIIFEQKQAIMFIFEGNYSGEKIKGEMPEYKWVRIEELKTMDISDFAEYYAIEMLTGYLQGKKNLLSAPKLDCRNYNKLAGNKLFERWKRGIINQNYDPEKLDDYKKWKSNGS